MISDVIAEKIVYTTSDGAQHPTPGMARHHILRNRTHDKLTDMSAYGSIDAGSLMDVIDDNLELLREYIAACDRMKAESLK